MSARESILNALKAKERNITPPAVWRSRRNFSDLTERFIASLNQVKGEAYHTQSLTEAVEKLTALLNEMNAQSVVANNETPFTGLNLPQRLPHLSWHTVGQSEGDLRAFCATADVGLSSADVALAETGTIAITSGPGKSRLATLLPPVHIALIPTSRLTADIFTWTAARQAPPPSSLTLISGPSKSADIEQTLAVGIHGPKRFIVILYNDE